MSFRPVWGGELSNLSQLYKQFIEILSLYQRFWDNFDEIKSRCWILEPEYPTYNTKEIRLALGKTRYAIVLFYSMALLLVKKPLLIKLQWIVFI